MYRNVLVSVVHPLMANAVADVCAAIVNLRGRITVLSVIEVPYNLPYVYAGPKMTEATRLVASVERAVDIAIGVEIEPKVVISRSGVDAVLNELKAGGYDLVIMGAYSPTKAERVLFGEAVDALIRHAPCDCVVLSSKGEGSPRYDRILLASHDFEHSQRSIDIAIALARWYENSSVETFCVAESPDEEDGKHALGRRILERLMGAGVRSSDKVAVSEQVVDGIVDEAVAGSYTMIIMEATHKARSYRFVLGSVVDEVVARAPCPVMVIRTHKESPMHPCSPRRARGKRTRQSRGPGADWEYSIETGEE